MYHTCEPRYISYVYREVLHLFLYKLAIQMYMINWNAWA